MNPIWPCCHLGAADAPRRRELADRFSEIATSLNEKLRLTSFDYIEVVEAVRRGERPEAGGSGEFNINNDTKFAKLTEEQILQVTEA